MKIAIVRLSSLGDIIFCMASLQLIRRHLPDARISWVADSKFADILDHNPDLEQVVKVDLKRAKKARSASGIVTEVRKVTAVGKCDTAIDLHGMLKSAAIAAKMGKKRCGFAWNVAKEPLATLFYNRTFALPLEMNTTLRYSMLAAQSLDFSFDEQELIDKEPFLYFSPKDAEISREHFRRDKKNVILVVGSTWESRNYPKEKLVTIANTLKENILICHGNQAEYETARYIVERSPYASILPKMSINQLKAAITQADLVIGGDTGPTHIAWANNVPCVVIFGPTPAHRIYPGTSCKILKSSSQVFEKKLNKNDFSIREIHENSVLELASELLAAGLRSPLRRIADAR